MSLDSFFIPLFSPFVMRFAIIRIWFIIRLLESQSNAMILQFHCVFFYNLTCYSRHWNRMPIRSQYKLVQTVRKYENLRIYAALGINFYWAIFDFQRKCMIQKWIKFYEIKRKIALHTISFILYLILSIQH